MNTKPKTPKNDTQAVVTVYLMDGFNSVSRLAQEAYSDISDVLGGNVGVAETLADFAHPIAEMLDVKLRDKDFPGVWYYEIGFELGIHFFNNHAISKDDFAKLAEMKTDEWFQKHAQT